MFKDIVQKPKSINMKSIGLCLLDENNKPIKVVNTKMNLTKELIDDAKNVYFIRTIIDNEIKYQIDRLPDIIGILLESKE